MDAIYMLCIEYTHTHTSAEYCSQSSALQYLCCGNKSFSSSCASLSLALSTNWQNTHNQRKGGARNAHHSQERGEWSEGTKGVTNRSTIRPRHRYWAVSLILHARQVYKKWNKLIQWLIFNFDIMCHKQQQLQSLRLLSFTVYNSIETTAEGKVNSIIFLYSHNSVFYSIKWLYGFVLALIALDCRLTVIEMLQRIKLRLTWVKESANHCLFRLKSHL